MDRSVKNSYTYCISGRFQMATFIYWSNKKIWHEKKLLEIQATNISAADKLFQKQTGLNPINNSWVGCEKLSELKKKK